jgi:hypothetical protein
MTGEPRGGHAKPAVVVRYRRPADRRSKPQRWTDAVETLLDVLDRYGRGATTCRPTSPRAP